MYRNLILTIVALTSVALLVHIQLHAPIVGTRIRKLAWHGADNATLGFGGIFVLTENVHTWRVQGLERAASLVGIDLIITSRDPRSDQDAIEYLQGDKLEYQIGSVKATMNYITLLQHFIEKDFETALFLEDDVDFNVMIRLQTKLLGNTLARRWQNISSRDPYGKDYWDILWLGHYGIQFTAQTRIALYADPYALPWANLTSDFNNYYQQMQSAETASGSTQQQVAFDVAPMSSYAWAITRTHAQWLVEELVSTRAQALDVHLHALCAGLRQRCIAPIPELLHHQHVNGSRSISTPGAARKRERLSWWRSVDKFTPNVAWSARCTAERSGKKVGDLWQCLHT